MRSETCQKQKWHPLFDHLVGLGKHGLRNREPQRLRSLQVDDQFELGRQLHRQVGRRCPAQDPIVLPNGRKLVTLLGAATYATKLSKKKAATAEWQPAIEALMLVAELGGPTMFARIGLMGH